MAPSRRFTAREKALLLASSKAKGQKAQEILAGLLQEFTKADTYSLPKAGA